MIIEIDNQILPAIENQIEDAVKRATFSESEEALAEYKTKATRYDSMEANKNMTSWP